MGVKYGVLRKLKHIFPNTYQRIKSIRSPAKVGLVVIDLITSPVVSWRGWDRVPKIVDLLLFTALHRQLAPPVLDHIGLFLKV